MEYQEIVTAYTKKGLEISDIKQMLDIAKPLNGREKYRVLDMIPKRSSLINDIRNLLIISEIQEKVKVFEKDCNNLLKEYYSILIQSIKNAKAWKFMGLVPSDYTIDKFSKLNENDKFKNVFYINKEYSNFLKYQNLADIRDCLRNGSELDDETIKRLKFLLMMFNNLKNKEVKKEFFCFDQKFLMTLIEFRKSKSLRLEEFIKTKRKQIQEEYEKFLAFFTNEDFRDISENLMLTSKTLKISVNNVIEAFYELSESESESSYLIEEINEFEKLKEKYLKMKELIVSNTLENKKIHNENKIVKQENEIAVNNKESLSIEQKIENIENIEKISKEQVMHKREEDLIKNIEAEKKLKEQVMTRRVKEKVNPLIFSWLEREDITLTRRMSSKYLTIFFDKIKQIEAETGTRVSLFIVTNASKEVALKRIQEFQKKAKNQGLPILVEGLLGGYSSFRIDSSGNIIDISLMSEVNRNKIINLIESITENKLSKDMIEQDEINYLRYQFSDKKNKEITREYLNSFVKSLLKNEVIRKQPIKLLPFMEGKYSGIDVVLESQLKGISQLADYYKTKYQILPGKTINVRIDDIESFLGDMKISS